MTTPVRCNRKKVFLAHSGGDKAYAREIYSLLDLDGFSPWLDERNLIAGQRWELEIAKAVEDSDAVVALLSAKAVDNAGYLHKEIALALEAAERLPEGSIKLIPIRLDQCQVPRKLQHLQWIDSERTVFSPLLTKSGILQWRREDWQALREFSIGKRYLEIRRALLAQDQQMDRETDYYRWARRRREDPLNLREAGELEFLVHGCLTGGDRYYGRSKIRYLETADHWGDRKVVVASSIEGGAHYRYEGVVSVGGLRVHGEHTVRYCFDETGELLVGLWGISANGDDAPGLPYGADDLEIKGLEELIVAHAGRNVTE